MDTTTARTADDEINTAADWARVVPDHAADIAEEDAAQAEIDADLSAAESADPQTVLCSCGCGHKTGWCGSGDLTPDVAVEKEQA